MSRQEETALYQYPKIAIVSDERYPKHTTNTQQVIKNATAFAMAGLPVELVIPLPTRGLFKKGYRVDQAIYQYYNVPDILKIKILTTIPSSKLRLEKYSHCFASVRYARKNNFDLIYTRNEVLAVYCMMIGRPFIFETYRRFGHEFPRGMRWLAEKDKKNNALFGMVLHSEVAAQSMEKAGIPREKMLVLHNGYDVSDMEPRLTQEEARKALDLPVKGFYAVYAGNAQPGKHVDGLVDIAAQLPNQTFIIVGGTEEDVKRLQARADVLNTKNVLLVGWKPIAEVSKYLYAANVLLIPPTAAPLLEVGRTVLPFKIFPYLASGRPTLAANTPDVTEILVDDFNSILVKPDDLAESVAALERLAANPDLEARLSANALATSTELTWEHRAQRFKDWLKTKFNKRKRDGMKE